VLVVLVAPTRPHHSKVPVLKQPVSRQQAEVEADHEPQPVLALRQVREVPAVVVAAKSTAQPVPAQLAKATTVAQARHLAHTSVQAVAVAKQPPV